MSSDQGGLGLTYVKGSSDAVASEPDSEQGGGAAPRRCGLAVVWQPWDPSLMEGPSSLGVCQLGWTG